MSPKRVGATENANRAPGGVQRRVGTKIRQASGPENALAKGSCGRFCKRLYTYKAGNRISLIKDGSNTINQYLYIGPGRVSDRKYVKASDGSTEVTTLHALYDGVGGITRWYHDKSDDTVMVGFQFDRDKVGNPNYELREHQSNYGDEYTYDNLHRLTRSIYDDSTPATPTASPSATTTDDFFYDLIGNRTTAYQKSANATTCLHNTVNEYTKETTDGTDTCYNHDAAGCARTDVPQLHSASSGPASSLRKKRRPGRVGIHEAAIHGDGS